MYKKTNPSRLAVFSLCSLFALSLMVAACDDNEDKDSSPKAQYVEFLAAEQQLGEGNGVTAVKLRTGEAALREGVIKVKIAGEQPGRIISEPAASEDGIITVPIQKGQTEIEISVTPQNNNDPDGNALFTFTLAEVSDGFVFGSRKMSELTVFDDDGPLKANFLLNVGSIRENNQNGLDLIMTFTGFTKAEGSLEIVADTKAIYGTDFITEPAMENGKLILNVPKDIEYASFRLIPINDYLVSGDTQLKFEIQAASGSVTMGDQKTVDITMTDDESYPYLTVADVRALYKGEDLILENMYLVAVVSSVRDNVGQKTTYLQDETGGIPIRLIFTNDFQRGDKLILNLGYGLMKETGGVLEIQQVSSADKLETAPLAYKILTLEQLHNSTTDIEGSLVMLHNLTFTEADGVKTMAGDRAISDGTRTVIVRTLGHASFRNQIVPGGDMIVKGIINEVNGLYIIYPQVFEEDVVANKDYEWPQ